MVILLKVVRLQWLPNENRFLSNNDNWEKYQTSAQQTGAMLYLTCNILNKSLNLSLTMKSKAFAKFLTSVELLRSLPGLTSTCSYLVAISGRCQLWMGQTCMGSLGEGHGTKAPRELGLWVLILRKPTGLLRGKFPEGNGLRIYCHPKPSVPQVSWVRKDITGCTRPF